MATRFKNLKVFHCDGYNPGMVLTQVLDFINAEENKNFKYVDSHVSYFYPKLNTVACGEPQGDIWVEVTILYEE